MFVLSLFSHSTPFGPYVTPHASHISRAFCLHPVRTGYWDGWWALAPEQVVHFRRYKECPRSVDSSPVVSWRFNRRLTLRDEPFWIYLTEMRLGSSQEEARLAPKQFDIEIEYRGKGEKMGEKKGEKQGEEKEPGETGSERIADGRLVDVQHASELASELTEDMLAKMKAIVTRVSNFGEEIPPTGGRAQLEPWPFSEDVGPLSLSDPYHKEGESSTRTSPRSPCSCEASVPVRYAS